MVHAQVKPVDRKDEEQKVTLTEIQKMALRDALASNDPRNWRTYTLEETGPGGPLILKIPKPFPTEP